MANGIITRDSIGARFDWLDDDPVTCETGREHDDFDGDIVLVYDDVEIRDEDSWDSAHLPTVDFFESRYSAFITSQMTIDSFTGKVALRAVHG